MVCEDARMPMKGVNFRMTFTMWKVLQDWLLCKPRHSVDAHTKMKEEKSFNKKKLTVSVARVDHPSSCLVQDIISLFFFFLHSASRSLPMSLSIYIFNAIVGAMHSYTVIIRSMAHSHIEFVCTMGQHNVTHEHGLLWQCRRIGHSGWQCPGHHHLYILILTPNLRGGEWIAVRNDAVDQMAMIQRYYQFREHAELIDFIYRISYVMDFLDLHLRWSSCLLGQSKLIDVRRSNRWIMNHGIRSDM